MDSMFVIDRTGHREFGLPTAVYNRDGLQFQEQTDESINYNHKEAEVKIFGLKLNRKEVDVAVSSSIACSGKVKSGISEDLDEVAERVSDAAKRSTEKRIKRKRVTELDYKSGLDLCMRQENMEKDMLRSRRTLDSGLDQRSALPTVRKRLQPILNRLERGKTKGTVWFNLAATEINEEMRNELKIIQMRSVLNPKQFYKKNDLKLLPKYFEIGVVEHSALDRYKEKNTRKTKKSLVDDLLKDEVFLKYNKRRYNETIQRSGKYAHRKNMNKMKKLIKNK